VLCCTTPNFTFIGVYYGPCTAKNGKFNQLLPRDAMLARYMLASCVRLSVRLSVRLFVRLSHADIVSKRPNVESCKQRHTIAQGSSFRMPKI